MAYVEPNSEKYLNDKNSLGVPLVIDLSKEWLLTRSWVDRVVELEKDQDNLIWSNEDWFERPENLTRIKNG